MEFKLLEKWMKDYEENRVNQLNRTLELMTKWKNALMTQRTLSVNDFGNPNSIEIPELRAYCCPKVTPRWYKVPEQVVVKNYSNEGGITLTTKEVNVIVDKLEVEGNLYDYYVGNGDYFRMKQKYDGLSELLNVNGCSDSDKGWLECGRTDEQIKDKAHKDMLNQKQTIESKVRKICGETIVSIDDNSGEIFAKGSNDRIAHLWASYAGGYNAGIIVNERHGQRLHIRVYVKEVRR